MGRLTIKQKPDYEELEGKLEFTVWKGKEYLGDIVKKRIYKKDQFWFFPDDFSMIGDMWFSADCLKEIANKLEELNS